MRNRKGTEKPIEIFVALFIILAVALVMLKLFQSQIAEKQKELSDVQQEQKSRELRNKVDQACKDKCVEASNNGCSPASLASLCTYGSKNVLLEGQYIDLNNDNEKNYDDSLLAGVGVCEERVYCFHLVSSCCARQISPETCKDILESYWTSKSMIKTGTTLNDLLTANVPAGTCAADENRWDTLAAWPAAS
jgi:hypothetical protein